MAVAVLASALSVAAPSLGARPRPSHPEVLIVVNSQSPPSVATGSYYATQRNVPTANILSLSIPLVDPNLGNTLDESLNRTLFDAQIRVPIQNFLTANGLTDSIRIIVLTPGIPLVVADACTLDAYFLRDCRRASVDAELAVLFSSLVGAGGVSAAAANPYLYSSQAFADWRAAHPTAALRYMVARLAGYQTPIDGATGVPSDVKKLIDNAEGYQPGGALLVDEDPALTNSPGLSGGSTLILKPAAALAGALGVPVQHDTTTTFVSNATLIAYASWGSNDNNDPGPPYYGTIGGPLYPGTFRPRAIAADIVSTNARSFVSPPSYGQSLIADLVKLGVAGAAGHVYEPLLSGVARSENLFRWYFRGVAAIEAYYRSIPYLSWQNVWVGDPLMMSFALYFPPASGDSDGDGDPDAADNCVNVPNANQRDTDGDGYGNVCDADLNNDGMVSTSWGVISPASQQGDLEKIQLTASGGPYNASHDLDGDNDVDVYDVSLAATQVWLPPGPKGP